MTVGVVDFEVRQSEIAGLTIIAMKQVTDERGTVRELFRRSAFEAAGLVLDRFEQINVTESRLGSVRGLHAEQMTKLVSVAAGRAFGVYLDARHGSATFGAVESVSLSPGVQVLVPSGVANGFQALAEPTQYVYCFDREWQPGMAGAGFAPLDPGLGIQWPLPIDADDPTQISTKDRTAPLFSDLMEVDS